MRRDPKKKIPELGTLATMELPKCKGKVMQTHPRYADCPVHAKSVGTMTDWQPERGMDQKLREFECPFKHAFYAIALGFTIDAHKKKKSQSRL